MCGIDKNIGVSWGRSVETAHDTGTPFFSGAR